MITKDNNINVMELFFKDPSRKFHLRELERLTGLSLPGVRKIVMRLQKSGLLESEYTKVVKNFYAKHDNKFILLKRLYNIYSIFSTGLLDFLRDKYEEPKAIVLFGSYSRGEDVSSSDIDIAVITQKRVELDLSSYEKKLSRIINLYEINIKTTEKDFLNALANGIVLYGYLEMII